MATFLIPAYNEEERIGPTLSQLTSSFPGYDVIVVFDGSDRTPEVVSRFNGVKLLRFGKRLGKGRAMIEGARVASGHDIIILIDADMPVTVEQIRHALGKMGDTDLLITERIYLDVPIRRLVLHLLFNALAATMFPALRRFSDWQGGFKVIKTRPFKEVMDELVINDFLIDTNLVYAFLRRGFKVISMKLIWKHEEKGSKVSGRLLKVFLIDFLSLVKLRVYYSPFRPVLNTNAFRRAQDFMLKVLR